MAYRIHHSRRWISLLLLLPILVRMTPMAAQRQPVTMEANSKEVVILPIITDRHTIRTKLMGIILHRMLTLLQPMKMVVETARHSSKMDIMSTTNIVLLIQPPILSTLLHHIIQRHLLPERAVVSGPMEAEEMGTARRIITILVRDRTELTRRRHTHLIRQQIITTSITSLRHLAALGLRPDTQTILVSSIHTMVVVKLATNSKSWNKASTRMDYTIQIMYHIMRRKAIGVGVATQN